MVFRGDAIYFQLVHSKSVLVGRFFAQSRSTDFDAVSQKMVALGHAFNGFVGYKFQ